LVQIPVLAGAVVLPVNLPGHTRENLSIPQVCSIFNGTAKVWSDVDPSFPNLAITIVFRSDGSGTSFAFTNFLATNCNPVPQSPFIINTDQLFANAVNLTWYAPNVPNPQMGNFNVVNTVKSIPGAVGYADPGDVQALAADYFDVATFDPLALTLVSVPSASLLVDTVLNGVTPGGVPDTDPIPPVVTTSNALTLVGPAFVVSGTYPIIAYTYLDFYNTNNNGLDVGSDSNAATALQNLVFHIYGSPAPTPLPAGYAYLDTADAGFFSKIIDAILSITN
jgi:ABC-type phosphate transport system substrate-binding protein